MRVRFCKKGPELSKFFITKEDAFKFEQRFFLEIIKSYFGGGLLL